MAKKIQTTIKLQFRLARLRLRRRSVRRSAHMA